jgi:chromosome partitioning protein
MAGQVTLEEVIQETELPLLKLIPANRNLAAAEVELVNEVGREFVLKQLLEAKPLPFDLILIDCPPSLSLLTINALAAAHSILIPIQAEYYALEGVSDLFKTVELVKKRINPTLAIEGVLLTMYSERTNLSNQVMEELTGHFKNRLYKSIIPRNVRLSEAPSFGKPVITYDVRSKGAQAYLQLAKEFIHGQA